MLFVCLLFVFYIQCVCVAPCRRLKGGDALPGCRSTNRPASTFDFYMLISAHLNTLTAQRVFH